MRVNISAARLPRCRMDREELLTADCELDPVRLLGKPLQQRHVDAVGLPGADAVRPEETLLVIAENSVNAATPEDLHYLVRETIFVDAVAKANHLIRIPERIQGLQQAGLVAVHIRDDPNPQNPLLLAKMFIAFRLMTTSACWLSTSTRVRTMPRSGFERERVASRTVTRMLSTSPGRTGQIQRNSSMPGEPRLVVWGRNRSTSNRIIRLAVCHPLAIRPPNGPRAAASR